MTNFEALTELMEDIAILSKGEKKQSIERVISAIKSREKVMIERLGATIVPDNVPDDYAMKLLSDSLIDSLKYAIRLDMNELAMSIIDHIELITLKIETNQNQ